MVAHQFGSANLSPDPSGSTRSNGRISEIAGSCLRPARHITGRSCSLIEVPHIVGLSRAAQ